MIARRKVPDGSGGSVPVGAGGNTKLLAKCPNLVAHLSLAVYDDGTERQPGLAILMTKGRGWQLILKDPDTTSKLVLVQDSLDDLLLAADLMLGTPDTIWEIDQYERGNRKRGRKK